MKQITTFDCASGDQTTLSAALNWNQIEIVADDDKIVLSGEDAARLGATLQHLALKARRQPCEVRSNSNRVEEFQAVLDLFAQLTGVESGPDADGPEVAVADLLAHALHYTVAKGVNFERCLEDGRDFFISECDL